MYSFVLDNNFSLLPIECCDEWSKIEPPNDLLSKLNYSKGHEHDTNLFKILINSTPKTHLEVPARPNCIKQKETEQNLQSIYKAALIIISRQTEMSFF